MDRRGGRRELTSWANGGRFRPRWLAGGLCALVVLAGCEAGPPEIGLREPETRVVIAGAAQGVVTSAVSGGIPVLGIFTGAAGTFVQVQPRVATPFPGQPSSRRGCPQLAGCVFAGP